MELKIKLGDISDNCNNWEKTADQIGIGYRAMNEGQVSRDEIFTIDSEKAKELGIIK